MAAPIWRGIMSNILLDVETVEGYKRRIAELKQQVASLEGELDVANKECEENLRRATELESKLEAVARISIHRKERINPPE